jgi:alanyl-tRNA synthetase
MASPTGLFKATCWLVYRFSSHCLGTMMEPTIKLFWTDPYRTTNIAKVASVADADVTLDSTIFFAFSGGQESDSGSISGIPVSSARKREMDIVYTMQSDHGLQVNQEVLVLVDWARRYRLMRLHFAAELVLELMYRELNSVDKVGAQSRHARLELTLPGSKASRLCYR